MKSLILATALIATSASAELTITPEVVDLSKFDLNQDGTIDIADFDIFRTMFGSNDPAGDFNGDGTVNLSDFSVFRASFGVTDQALVRVTCR